MRIRNFVSIGFLVAMIALSVSSFAGPAWQVNGVPASIITAPQENPSILSLGQNGMITAWADDRGSDYDIYAQRLDTAGNQIWTYGGVLVCGAIYDQDSVELVTDGAGGAIAVWQDGRAGDGDTDLYAQRIDSDGNVNALWPTDGLGVCVHNLDVPWSAYGQMITSDGAGGVIIAWCDTRTDPNNFLADAEIYAQRINGSGVAQWATNGVPVVSYGGQPEWDCENIVIAPDGSNGAIIAWQDDRNELTSGYDFYAQRISPSGTGMWATDGIVVCNAPYDQAYYSDIVGMGGGNCVLVWEDERNSTPTVTNYNVYAQSLSSTGAVQWAANGRPVAQSPGNQRTPRAVSDGSGGVIVAWQDSRNPSTAPDIYAQRLDSTGNMLWASGGSPVCLAQGFQGRIRLTPGSSGNTMLAWTDDRQDPSGVTYYYDIYAQLLNSAGTAQWPTNGIPVTSAPGTQELQQITTDSAGGAYLVWQDDQNDIVDETYAIYAQRMTPTSPVSCSSLASAKTYADGCYVSLPQRVVTAVFPDCFYIEEPTRFAGIKVTPDLSQINVGDLVSVTGTLTTTCERSVVAETIVDAGASAALTPLGITTSKLGGSTIGLIPGVGGVSGFNNIGLLVRAWGKFAYVDPRTFTITDGKGAVVACVVPSGVSINSSWSYVAATGISSCVVSGTSAVPQLRVRSQTDISAF